MLQEAQALMAQIHGEIPLTAAMRVQAVEYDGLRLVLQVPLGANINDKGTAFAGSIAALANLTGWAMLMLWVEERFGPCQVAIYHSDIHYKKPLKSDFTAAVELPLGEPLQALEKSLEHKRRAKFSLDVELAGEGGTAVIMHGSYAIWLVEEND